MKVPQQIEQLRLRVFTGVRDTQQADTFPEHRLPAKGAVPAVGQPSACLFTANQFIKQKIHIKGCQLPLLFRRARNQRPTAFVLRRQTFSIALFIRGSGSGTGGIKPVFVKAFAHRRRAVRPAKRFDIKDHILADRHILPETEPMFLQKRKRKTDADAVAKIKGKKRRAVRCRQRLARQHLTGGQAVFLPAVARHEGNIGKQHLRPPFLCPLTKNQREALPRPIVAVQKKDIRSLCPVQTGVAGSGNTAILLPDHSDIFFLIQ